MAKRRETPPRNPLSSDLIAAAVKPVSQDKAEEQDAESRRVGEEASPRRHERQRSQGQKTLRVRFPDIECEENAEFTKTLRLLMSSGRTPNKVTESDITRALWSLARRAEEAMMDLESKAPKLRRPPNGDWMAKAEYDDAIAHFLHLAIKRTSARE